MDIIDRIVAGTATWTEVFETAARGADAWADRAEERRDVEHTCPRHRCCWHDPEPFRALAAEHRARAAR